VNQIQTENIPKIQIDFQNSKFDELFLEAIDQSFLILLGTHSKQAFFSFLDKKYKLSKEDIPNRIEDFADGLEKIFGPTAFLLELAIMKALKHKVPSFSYLLEGSNLSFEVYVESLKRHLENS
jgi:hypothetical protein